MFEITLTNKKLFKVPNYYVIFFLSSILFLSNPIKSKDLILIKGKHNLKFHAHLKNTNQITKVKDKVMKHIIYLYYIVYHVQKLT